MRLGCRVLQWKEEREHAAEEVKAVARSVVEVLGGVCVVLSVVSQGERVTDGAWRRCLASLLVGDSWRNCRQCCSQPASYYVRRLLCLYACMRPSE